MQSVTRYQKNALHSTNPSTRTLSNTVFDLLAYVEGLRGLQASDWLILVIRHEYQLLTTQVRIPPKSLGG